ncbi:MAG TPA: glycine--tRNA ligase subunit beta [Anaerolineales bacterium]|nr:glycine--tRNA ligase subunit beta [Anaerolineales bacterium]
MPLNFQQIILTLQNFWVDQGCLLWQPYYSQVGAGTMNPATSLRVLGPEPWNVAYVEPSVRPDDGRYGDNPNRFQLHYQFQVILKPDPGNPQELYLQSLEALGIDPQRHDVRFVEDNWESPALGAWGLGWEVWLDGQEITQFTYFQQAGGMPLDPVSVEITYGLERIAIALHGVASAWEIPWNDRITYGEIRKIEEVEHSRYYFDTADVERLHEMYQLAEAEARSALAAGLVLPAHDQVLKLSHLFNVLDTRGAIGVTERQAFFRQMRGLSRAVAEAYVAQREELGHPWLEETGDGGPETEDRGRETGSPVAVPGLPSPVSGPPSPVAFLLEIGTEELPPADVVDAVAQLEARVPAMLAGLHLEHGEVRVLATPRRLVVHVEDLAARQPDREQVFRGPPADRAFDADGNPTKAAEGFARGRGVEPAALVVEEIDGGRYAVARVQEMGRPSVEVLAEGLPGLISGLKFGKSMRWNESAFAFSRPIRWLLALHGEAVVPFELAGLIAGRTTRSIRFHDPEEIEIRDAAGYFATLAAQGILLDPAARRAAIAEQVQAAAESAGGEAVLDPGLLDEVAQLVESPNALLGAFDETFLSLPPEVLVSVMRKHQRYFPVIEASSERGSGDFEVGAGFTGAHLKIAKAPFVLRSDFITVRNGGSGGAEDVIAGNEHVLQARFADAAFFVHNDLKKPLEGFLPRLDTLTFQAQLGSMLDKTHRIEEIVVALAPRVGLTPDEEQHARRAARLCKADLATSMVVEMTSLQGVLGRYYALQSGEPAEVAEAIAGHYLPKSAGDKSPTDKISLTVGLADRLDSLVGLFGAGLQPSGSKDPFGLRRAALGLVQLVVDWDLDLDLKAALRSASTRQPIEIDAATQAEVLVFIVERQRGLVLDGGYRFDVVDAVLAVQGHTPAAARRGVQTLSEWVSREDWDKILPAYSRCVRITRTEVDTHPVDPGKFVDAAEKALFAALEPAEGAIAKGGKDRVAVFLAAFEPMIAAIDRFFEDVLVMVEDEDLRRNRLGLLQRIAALADGAADMARLEGF